MGLCAWCCMEVVVIQSIARIALALFLLGGIIGALSRHGSTVPTYRFHGGVYVAGVAFEGFLIWLAGGFGL